MIERAKVAMTNLANNARSASISLEEMVSKARTN